LDRAGEPIRKRVVRPWFSGQDFAMSRCPLNRNVGELERLGCLAVGSWLFLKGVLSRRTSGTLMGGLLVYRGLSGNCKLYEALGVDTRSPAEKAE
jgi:hypothetical protein